MTTKTKVNNPIQIAQAYILKPGFSRHLIAAVILMAIVIIGLIVTNLPTTATVTAPQQVIENKAGAASSLLAANPELSIAHRYASSGVERAEAIFLAANPELSVAHRYTSMVEKGAEATFLAANPELSVAHRYMAMTASETKGTPALEAEAARYNGLATFYLNENEAAGSGFLASNPELSVAHRYDALVAWNRHHHPGR